MGKIYSQDEIKLRILEEKIKLYEFENTELQIILNDYLNKLGKKRDSNISLRDEIYLALNNNKNREKKRNFFNKVIRSIKKNRK